MSFGLQKLFFYFSNKEWEAARNSGPDIGRPGRVRQPDGTLKLFQYTAISLKPDERLGEVVYEGPLDAVEDPRQNGWPTEPFAVVS